MEQEIIDFDPFEPLFIATGYFGDFEEYIDSEPMTDDDWEEWLNNELPAIL